MLFMGLRRGVWLIGRSDIFKYVQFAVVIYIARVLEDGMLTVTTYARLNNSIPPHVIWHTVVPVPTTNFQVFRSTYSTFLHVLSLLLQYIIYDQTRLPSQAKLRTQAQATSTNHDHRERTSRRQDSEHFCGMLYRQSTARGS